MKFFAYFKEYKSFGTFNDFLPPSYLCGNPECINSGRGDGGAGGALAPPLFAKMKFLEPLLFYFGISKVNT